MKNFIGAVFLGIFDLINLPNYVYKEKIQQQSNA